MKPIYLAAIAALWPLSVQAEDCEAAVTQADLTECSWADWQAADAELNAAWKGAVAVMKAIDADLPEEEQGAVKNLRTGQRAWIEFRDANCLAEGYLMHGGSAEPMLVYGCMAQLTRTRTADLVLMASDGM